MAPCKVVNPFLGLGLRQSCIYFDACIEMVGSDGRSKVLDLWLPFLRAARSMSEGRVE